MDDGIEALGDRRRLVLLHRLEHTIESAAVPPFSE
jgi:hypothetical protein